MKTHPRWLSRAGSTLATLALLTSCATDHETEATLEVKAYVDGNLEELRAAALDLQAAAPEPDADGWNATDDADAVEAMRDAWKRTRVAYERVEGAIAVLFPNLDVSTDERYDGFIELQPDPDLFDGEGATGMHAIERILYADQHPPQVVAFESSLPNYQEARFPQNEEEARRFRDGLVERLVMDVTTMRDQFAPLALDPAAAYRGVVGSMAEQLEKVTLAATGEDESRYSEATLADMRANLEGGRAIYGAFDEWVRAEGGEDVDARVQAGFDRIDAAYAPIEGDALPPVPEGWNPDEPDPAHLETEYGQLWSLLTFESDPRAEGSLVSDMNEAAELIGIPLLP
ncbi:MAG TPA: imelysin family protein [Sandaracinaceae bacterium LLY-WYZ-13_1]|nr:imelysin family protein [Sandaracinaceae bacterium LLY-WYZ-13_1]